MTAGKRAIPAVEKVLQAIDPTDLPRSVLVSLVRRELERLRRGKTVPPVEDILQTIRTAATHSARQRIQRVINGTGIIAHTNLGRAPLSAKATQAVLSVAENFSNVELDLVSGERGHRAGFLEQSLAAACGAEAATIVNNCAAALVLVLRHFVKGDRNEVIISRGELVQIGGGFRIPEVLEASGARLREVGTTNKTAVSDYAKAIGKRTALLLKVHRSNFFMGGFVESPDTRELAVLARKKRVPFVEDLGSGAMIGTEEIPGLEHEPTPAETLKQGVDLVTFSGDKLLGGPQAGIIAGRQKFVAALKRDPFFRALRCGKLVLAALEATVEQYLADQHDEIPVIAMLKTAIEEIRGRAEKIAVSLAQAGVKVTIAEGKSQVGGGTLPRSEIPSVTLEFLSANPAALAARLRSASPSVIGYVWSRRFKLDLRTVFPGQDAALIEAVKQAHSG